MLPIVHDDLHRTRADAVRARRQAARGSSQEDLARLGRHLPPLRSARSRAAKSRCGWTSSWTFSRCSVSASRSAVGVEIAVHRSGLSDRYPRQRSSRDDPAGGGSASKPEAAVYKRGAEAASLYRHHDGVEFSYRRDYVHGGSRASRSQPRFRSGEDVGALPCRSALPPFFSGLLPEGRRLTALRQAVKTSADDELSLLLADRLRRHRRRSNRARSDPRRKHGGGGRHRRSPGSEVRFTQALRSIHRPVGTRSRRHPGRPGQGLGADDGRPRGPSAEIASS